MAHTVPSFNDGNSSRQVIIDEVEFYLVRRNDSLGTSGFEAEYIGSDYSFIHSKELQSQIQACCTSGQTCILPIYENIDHELQGYMALESHIVNNNENSTALTSVYI